MRCASYDDWEITPPRGAADVKTVVLVGKTGNGKSATGNTLIGRQGFDSMPSLGGVTSTCQLQTTVLDDGHILNVIDTPGLFDSSVEPREMAKEIAKCINMAKDGIRAVLLVLSLGSRFSEEEASPFESLCQIFGGKIADYMIVVFAHGDVLEKCKTSLNDFLRNCPQLLMNTLAMCGNRRVVFDNMTEDGVKISRQREELLSLVRAVVENNGGKPYTNDLFDELKKKEMDLIDQTTEGKSPEGKFPVSNEEQFERFIVMVESRMKESITSLEKAARMEAEVKALEALTKSKDEALEMTKRLKRAEELRRELEGKLNHTQSQLGRVNCAIM